MFAWRIKGMCNEWFAMAMCGGGAGVGGVPSVRLVEGGGVLIMFITMQAWGLLGAFLLVLLLAAWPLGKWLSKVGTGDLPNWALRVERPLYRLAGVRVDEGMKWPRYALALLLFNLAGVLMVYALQRWQAALPLNPQGLGAIAPDSALNTAIAFVTNTNWQGYVGESTMGYGVQMLGLSVQNFFSAATGMSVAYALVRALAAKGVGHIGNFWADVTRSTLFVLLPLSLVFAVFLVGQGVIQNFKPSVEVHTLEAQTWNEPKLDAAGQAVLEQRAGQTQTIAMGPVASQEAIKMIGTNGGGFFNANSAHPYENPTPLSNFMQMLSIFLIPAGLCFAFGEMVGDRRQGLAILVAMMVLFVVMTVPLIHLELQANPAWQGLPIDSDPSAAQAGGNMEGKETRFGIAASALFAAITTAASCGAVNTMHDSLQPLGGLVPLGFIQLGEVVFGGVGSGLYGMLLFAVLTVFIAGLMIGRTPEYVGKKIEAYDMKMVSLAMLVTPMLVLGGSAIAVLSDAGLAGVSNPGPHGFTQILYAFSSAANNNGSAFAGLSTNTPFYNTLLAVAMWFGRFAVIVPVLAVAGSLARKKRLSVSVGSMPTHGPLFIALLIGTVVIVGALTYMPALALGPIAEHLQVMSTALPH
jgi:K+-transporting ATPase ATPase A chain